MYVCGLHKLIPFVIVKIKLFLLKPREWLNSVNIPHTDVTSFCTSYSCHNYAMFMDPQALLEFLTWCTPPMSGVLSCYWVANVEGHNVLDCSTFWVDFGMNAAKEQVKWICLVVCLKVEDNLRPVVWYGRGGREGGREEGVRASSTPYMCI
jgi:hypothetical protein